MFDESGITEAGRIRILESGRDIVAEAIESRDPEMAVEAIREIEARARSLQDPTEKANVLMRKAVLYGVLHRFSDARNQLRIALQEAPEDVFTQVQHDVITASLYDEEGKWKDAYENLTETFLKHAQHFNRPELRSVYEDIQQRRGFDLVRIQKFRDAIPILKEVLSFELVASLKSAVLSNLGSCYAMAEEYPNARDCFEKAIAIGLMKEWESRVHFYLGYSYAYLRLLREAKREFQWCEQQPQNEYSMPLAKVYGWLSSICKHLGEQREAEHYARLARPT
jgi:tetratricopeptide (TPR) repeat protein